MSKSNTDTALFRISCRYNHLTSESIPKALASCALLEEFNIENNSVSCLPDGLLSSLESLSSITVSRNQVITTHVQEGACQKLYTHTKSACQLPEFVLTAFCFSVLCISHWRPGSICEHEVSQHGAQPVRQDPLWHFLTGQKPHRAQHERKPADILTNRSVLNLLLYLFVSFDRKKVLNHSLISS